MVKQRRESIDQFRKGGRNDLAEKELKEIAIIEKYLPAAPTDAELHSAIESAIDEEGADSLKQMGAVVKAARAKLEGKAIDGKLLSDKVRERLTENNPKLRSNRQSQSAVIHSLVDGAFASRHVGRAPQGSDAWRGTDCLFSLICEVVHVATCDAWSTLNALVTVRTLAARVSAGGADCSSWPFSRERVFGACCSSGHASGGMT